MKTFCSAIVFLISFSFLQGCLPTRAGKVKSISLFLLVILAACSSQKHTFGGRDGVSSPDEYISRINIGISYIEHFDYEQIKRDDWGFLDDTTIKIPKLARKVFRKMQRNDQVAEDTSTLFSRLEGLVTNEFGNTYPHLPMVVEKSANPCLKWGEFFSHDSLDTLSLQSCLSQRKDVWTKQVFIHIMFQTGFISSNSFYGPSAYRISDYMAYVAAVNGEDLVYFIFFRNRGGFLFGEGFSEKRERKVLGQIQQELQRSISIQNDMGQ